MPVCLKKDDSNDARLPNPTLTDNPVILYLAALLWEINLMASFILSEFI